MALPREPAGEDVAVLAIGRPKGGASGPPRGGDMSEMMGGGAMEPDGDEGLPPGFESAASEAFPDMDPANYGALKRLIALCMESGESY